MISERFKRYTGGRDKASAKDLNRRAETIEKVSRSSPAMSMVDAAGILTRQRSFSNTLISSGMIVFEVQSVASGDGIYNCYVQILDSTEWVDTSGDDKFDDLNTDSIEVLNLNESFPEGTYYAELASGDLILAWQTLDDEDNLRWIGTPIINRPVNETFGITRSAKISALGTDNVTAKILDSDGSIVGSSKTVYVREHLGTNNISGFEVWPDLRVNDYILTARERDNKWYFYGTMDDITDCDA